MIDRFALTYLAGLVFALLTVACSDNGEPGPQAPTPSVGEAARPTLTLVPPPTKTPSPTLAPMRTPMPTVAPFALGEMTAEQIYEQLSPSVAYIEVPDGSATGFLIEGGYVVTNHHVVWPWEEARVVFPGGPEIVAPVAAWDPMSDVALLGPVRAAIPPLELGDGENLPIGSEVFLMGYPGEVDSSPSPTILSGLLSHYRQWDLLRMTYLQTDVAVAGGQSGGVLLNSEGEVIGITTFRFTEAGYGLAASASDLEPILEQLIQGRDPLGVSNRSLWKGRPGNEFHGDLQNPWDSRMFLMELNSGDSVEIEMGCAKPVGFNVTDPDGNVLLDADNSFGGVEQVSGEVQMEGHHFLTVQSSAHSSSCFELSANVPMIPFADPDDGRRLNLSDTIAGNIDYPGDRDWYSIHLEEGEVVRISADSLNFDTILHVDFANSRVSQVLQDDDSGGGLFETNSELVYHAPVEGEYFLVVEGYDGWDVWNRGGYFLSVDRAPSGAEGAEVPPGREKVDSPFGKMIVFESQLSDFSVQVPAGWVVAGLDQGEPYFTFSATNIDAEEKEIGFVGILEFDLAESDEEQTLVEFADSLAEELTGAGVETHRENIVTSSGDPGMILEFQQEFEADQLGAVRMLVSVQDGRFAFVVFYVFTEHESHRALAEYSFSTLDSSDSSGVGKYFLGRVLHVNVVSMELLPELRYSTIDPDSVVRRWSLFPSKLGSGLVLVRLKVENHTADNAIINVDRDAAVLQALDGASYWPVSIAETVWQDFRGDAEAVVRVDQGQCFDGARALVDEGTTVQWQNEAGSEQHLDFQSLDLEDGSLAGVTVKLGAGASYSHVFNDSGIYPYACGGPDRAERHAEIWVMPAGHREEVAERSVLFLNGDYELQKGYGLDGYMVFEVPAGKELHALAWRTGDNVTVPLNDQLGQADAQARPENLLAYAARHAGGPGAVYVGDLNQLAGAAPSRELGDPDGNVPLESLERHRWIYESPFYQELLEKARLTDPTPMTYDGETITIRHACINLALLPCILLESYLAPNLRERTNGKVQFITSSFAYLGLAGPDTLSLIADGTLDSVTVYGGYVGRDIPAIEIQNLWGVYESQEQEFEAAQSIIGDIEDLVLAETGGAVFNHSWYPGSDQFLFCRERIDSLDALAGKRTRSNSAALSDWIRGMGAEARFVPFAEVYEDLDRGILDCGGTGADPAYGQRWYEVTDYLVGPLFNLPSANNVISAEKWDSMPDDLRQIIYEEGAKSELEALRLASIQNEIGLIKNRNAGMELVPFSAEMRHLSFDAAVEHVIPRWLRRLGYPERGQEIVDVFNLKVGPVVGLRIETDGRVVGVSP